MVSKDVLQLPKLHLVFVHPNIPVHIGVCVCVCVYVCVCAFELHEIEKKLH